MEQEQVHAVRNTNTTQWKYPNISASVWFRCRYYEVNNQKARNTN